MKRNNYTLLLFLLSAGMLFSQSQEKLLLIKVMADGNYVGGINVVNLVNEKSAVTDEKGEFFISAKEDDLLVFSAINFEYKRKIISKEDILAGAITVNVIPKTTSLDEVEITKYKDLDAFELGILETPAKRYTPAERRLRTAGDFKPVHLVGLLFGQFPLDPVLNAINGKTKRLKKEVEIEQQEFLLKKVEDMFQDDYFLGHLKIPENYIQGFKLYSIGDENFVRLLEDKNKIKSEFELARLSKEYLKLISNEN
ncbi:MAG: hypothetical protein DI588_10930 [Flavobacterium johnsoniae]|nr:MAG: hypothetical protein DI588_10930 [Flavobacterium johnsoniae]